MRALQTHAWASCRKRNQHKIFLTRTHTKSLSLNTLIKHNLSTTTISYTSPDTLADENIDHFRLNYFQVEKPAVLRYADLCLGLPAYRNWFLERSLGTSNLDNDDESKGLQVQLNYQYLSTYGDTLVPLEMTTSYSQEEERIKDINDDAYVDNVQFQRFNAPLSMFLNWTAADQRKRSSANSSTTVIDRNNMRIYLAQCHVEDLPLQLQSDFQPTPSLVSQTGKSDVYATNLWIGAPPTYTPLHKDPNPNLFVQLAGTKHIRLLPPHTGLKVFARVRQQQHELMAAKKGNQASSLGHAAAFRGNEMMEGTERVLLERAIWSDMATSFSSSSSSSSSSSDVNTKDKSGYDVVLGRGDALFIPKGWWHSIKGVGEGITASVNWWFR